MKVGTYMYVPVMYTGLPDGGTVGHSTVAYR